MIHSVKYDYLTRKVTVTAEHCKVRIEISETETGNGIYSCDHDVKDRTSVWAEIARKWHCDMTIKVFADGQLHHLERTSLKGKTVRILLDSKALGDTLAWFPSVVEFQQKHGCIVLAATFHNHLFRKYENEGLQLCGVYDATSHDVNYRIGVFNDTNMDPCCFRTKPLEKCAADILGLVYREQHLDLRYLAHARPIKEKYAVICTTSTMAAKEWQNPDGWQSIVDHLNESGYKVVCAPKPRPPLTLRRLHDVEVPEDLVAGALTYIRHAEIFIGLGSGLTWLARALDVPAVMISGFSEPFAEFKTGLARVAAPKDVCHGCYNDASIEFGRNWGWCPRNNGGNNFICTRKIEPDMVKLALGRVPSTKPSGRKRLMCVLPHCSTGGLPQYFLLKLLAMREAYDTYVLEWSFQGDAFNIQRNQIRDLCTEFIELGMFRRRFQSVVDSIAPDIIHFEELPSTFENNDILEAFFKQYRRPVFHTSHGSAIQKVWNASKYVFPSAHHLKLYPYVDGEVIEYPIFGEPIDAAPENSILNVGILSSHKNQGYLTQVARLMPETKFYFAGPMAQNFEAYWRPMVKSAPGNCSFLGQQNQDQVRALYRKCKLLVHPSLTELAPIVFTEALSNGSQVFTNWLPTYESLSYKEHLNRLTMDPAKDAELLKEHLASDAVHQRPPAADRVFRQKVLELYL